METTQHTPAPWTFEQHRPDSQWLGNIVGHYGDRNIRTISCQTKYGTEAESLANAHLIAAAPDLLAACKDTLATLEEWGEGEAAQSLREVIAKAEGSVTK